MPIYKKMLLFITCLYLPGVAITALGVTNWLEDKIEQYQTQTLAKGEDVANSVLENDYHQLQNLLAAYSQPLGSQLTTHDELSQVHIGNPLTLIVSSLDNTQTTKTQTNNSQTTNSQINKSIELGNEKLGISFKQIELINTLENSQEPIYLWHQNQAYMLAATSIKTKPANLSQRAYNLTLARPLTAEYLSHLFSTTNLVNQILISPSPGIGTPQSNLAQRIQLQGIATSTPLFAHVELSSLSFEEFKGYLVWLPWIMLLIGVLLLVPICLWLNKGILAPFKQFNNTIKSLTSDSSNLDLLTVPASSEFDDMAKSIRQLLSLHQQHKQQADMTLASISDAVFICNNQARLTYLNPQAEALIGTSLGQALSQDFDSLLNFDNRLSQQLTESMLVSGRNSYTDKTKLKVTPIKLVERRISNLLSPKGQVIGCIIVLRDITQDEIIKSQLRHKALYDSLTGLLNRDAFEHKLTGYTRTAQEISACYLAVNQLRLVNANRGRDQGNLMLSNIAHSMKSSLKGKGLLARLGDDEFGLVLRNCSAKNTQLIMQHVTSQAAQSLSKLELDPVDFSVGIAHGADCDNVLSLLEAADVACINGRQKGGNQILLADELESELELFCEPILPIAQPPQDEFLTILGKALEPSASIRLRQAPDTRYQDNTEKQSQHLILQTFSWLSANLTNEALPYFSINLSIAQLTSSSMVDYIIQQVKVHKLACHPLCFELADLNSYDASNKDLAQLNRLASQGFSFALDDIGDNTGSYRYLKALPIAYVKIDGELIQGLNQHSDTEEQIRTLHHVCSTMGVATLAKQVDSAQCIQQLKTIGIHYAQGEAIGKAQPLDQYVKKRNIQIA